MCPLNDDKIGLHVLQFLISLKSLSDPPRSGRSVGNPSKFVRVPPKQGIRSNQNSDLTHQHCNVPHKKTWISLSSPQFTCQNMTYAMFPLQSRTQRFAQRRLAAQHRHLLQQLALLCLAKSALQITEMWKVGGSPNEPWLVNNFGVVILRLSPLNMYHLYKYIYIYII